MGVQAKLVDLEVELRHETDNAILISDDGKRGIWLPKSQVEFEPVDGKTGIVTLPEWLAIEKELV